MVSPQDRSFKYTAMIYQVIATLALIIIIVYLKGVRNARYWNKRGVVFHDRNRAVGVAWDCVTQSRAYFEHFHDIYERYAGEPAVGIGSVLKPAIFLRDMSNITHVLSTDFDAFNHKGIETIEEDTLAQNLFILQGAKWKVVRQKMSPLFTTRKLRSMFQIMDKSARDIVPYIMKNPHLMKGNAYDTLSMFCSAAMSAVVFGVPTESIFDSPFLKFTQKVSKPTLRFYLKSIVSVVAPQLVRSLRIKIFSEFEEFFVGAIKKLLRTREISNTRRYDFAELCLSIQRNGVMTDTASGLEVEPTDELLAAQGFLFFIAGVEPTAVTIYNTLVLLGQHPDVLQRLHNEIDKVFEQNEAISYDIISEIEYLEMVFNEASRIYPAIGYLVRECERDSVLPVGNIRIEKGTTVFLPIFSIHHDDNYYPDPEVFNPERFSNENKSNFIKKPLLHFGKGNRTCLGMRFATLQAKAGIVHLLHNFTVRTILHEGGIKYKKDQLQVILTNVDVEFIERKVD